MGIWQCVCVCVCVCMYVFVYLGDQFVIVYLARISVYLFISIFFYKGYWESAQDCFEEAMNSAQQQSITLRDAEFQVWEEHWIDCSIKLGQFDNLFKFADEMKHHDLMLLTSYRLKNWKKMKEILGKVGCKLCGVIVVCVCVCVCVLCAVYVLCVYTVLFVVCVLCICVGECFHKQFEYSFFQYINFYFDVCGKINHLTG